MTTKELIEYLQGFNMDSKVMIQPVCLDKRVVYNPVGIIGVTDAERPMVFVEVDGEEPLDDASSVFGKEEDA